MSNIICRDRYGSPIEFLSQWDLNIVIAVEGIDLTRSPRVRFSNKCGSSSLVVRPVVVGNLVYVDIPNVLLQQPYPITTRIFYEYESGMVLTKYIFNIPVVPCPKPVDYAATDNVDYVDWLEIQERAEELMEELGETREDDVLIVDSSEPTLTDIIWFDTSSYQNGEDVYSSNIIVDSDGYMASATEGFSVDENGYLVL